MSRSAIPLLAIPLVLVLSLSYGCGKKKEMREVAGPGEATNTAEAIPAGQKTGLSGTMVNSVREIHIKAFKFAFDPNVVTVKKGDRVLIIAKSTDDTHGLSIPGYKINKTLPPNQEEKIEFTADKTGTFPFECSVYCGSGHEKMKGKLIVEE